MQPQDFALARQEVVLDVEPLHGLEMAAQHSNGDQFGDDRSFITALLDVMQSLQTNLKVLLVLRIPLRDAGIEVPAVVVELRLAGQLLDFRARLLFQMQKAHDDVRHLHAGVVDVVLHIDFPARRAQQANKGVAENCVAQMADVRGFIRIDAGVLDQNLAGWNCGRRFLIGGQRSRKTFPLHPGIDVARARDFELLEAFHRANAGDDLLGNLARSLAQLFGKFKRQRQRILSQFDLGRLLDHDFGEIQAVGALQKSAHLLGQAVFQMSIQESL